MRSVDDRLKSSRRDIVDESSKKLVEIVRRFPEWHVPQSRQAMAPPFPQIRIFRNLEIIEIDEWILTAVHHGQRDGKVFDQQPLIDSDSRTCRFEDCLMGQTVGARYCAPKFGGDRRTED